MLGHVNIFARACAHTTFCPNVHTNDSKSGGIKKRLGWLLSHTIRLFGVIYVALGLLKLHNLSFPRDVTLEYLHLANPIFPVATNQVILMFAGVVELIAGFFLVFFKGPLKTVSYTLLWLVGITFAYKIGLLIIQYKGPCGCMLGINKLLPISMATQKWLSDIILIAALITSVVSLLYAKVCRSMERCKI